MHPRRADLGGQLHQGRAHARFHLRGIAAVGLGHAEGGEIEHLPAGILAERLELARIGPVGKEVEQQSAQFAGARRFGQHARKQPFGQFAEETEMVRQARFGEQFRALAFSHNCAQRRGSLALPFGIALEHVEQVLHPLRMHAGSLFTLGAAVDQHPAHEVRKPVEPRRRARAGIGSREKGVEADMRVGGLAPARNPPFQAGNHGNQKGARGRTAIIIGYRSKSCQPRPRMSQLKIEIAEIVAAAAGKALGENVSSAEIEIERPKNADHGDFATSIALKRAKAAGRKPREVAEAIAAALGSHAKIARVDVAGPGFINLTLSKATRFAAVAEIFAARDDYGRGAPGAGEQIMVEFVSANPTGPLHVGHGRQAALATPSRRCSSGRAGRCARVLLQRRRQPDRQSRAAACRRASARPGAAVRDAERRLSRRLHPRDRARLHRASTRRMPPARSSTGSASSPWPACAASRTPTCSAFGVKFDSYFLESSLYSDGKVDEAVTLLKAGGRTYESEGALWLKTTDFGDDKDRVMRKSRRDLHVLRAGRRVPPRQVPPRLHACCQRAGRRPPQHGHSRARGAAGARLGIPAGLSRLRAAPDGDSDAGAAKR